MRNDLIALAERVESLLDRARPVEWEAIDDAICDKEYGFTLGRMDSEIYPSDYDAANAELVVALVNAAPTIAAALRAEKAEALLRECRVSLFEVADELSACAPMMSGREGFGDVMRALGQARATLTAIDAHLAGEPAKGDEA